MKSKDIIIQIASTEASKEQVANYIQEALEGWGGQIQYDDTPLSKGLDVTAVGLSVNTFRYIKGDNSCNVKP